MKLLVAVILTLLIVLTLTPAASSVRINGRYEQNIVKRVNDVRENHGLIKVQPARCIDIKAERWADLLNNRGLFFHSNLDRIIYGCNMQWSGENLARGDIKPRRVVRLWMHSPLHRKVLLAPQARVVGVGHSGDTTVLNFGRH